MTAGMRPSLALHREPEKSGWEVALNVPLKMMYWLVSPFLTHCLYIDVLQLIAGTLVLLTAAVKAEAWSPFVMGGDTKIKGMVWCPRKSTTCVNPKDWVQVLMVVLARGSAGAMYVVFFLCSATTMHSTATWLGRRARVRLCDGLFGGQARDVHIRAGKVLARLALLHGVAHYIRYICREEARAASKVPMVILGVISTAAFGAIHPLLTCVRRNVIKLYGEDAMSFEKTMRYFHHVTVIVGLLTGVAHHWRLAIIGSVLFVLWSLDKLYLIIYRSFIIESPHLAVCGRADEPGGGVLVTFQNPKSGFDFETGDYVRVRFPWMPGHHGKEYHPFSIAPVSVGKLSDRSMLYLQVEGDWTKAMKETVAARGNGNSLPMLLVGPFASPFNGSFMHQYLLLVASGIGITPSLSVLARLGKNRHVCVLWICRDVELVRLYADYLHPECGLCEQAIVHITTATPETLPQDLPGITLKAGRPDIEAVTRRIVTGGDGSFDVDTYDDRESSSHAIVPIFTDLDKTAPLEAVNEDNEPNTGATQDIVTETNTVTATNSSATDVVPDLPAGKDDIESGRPSGFREWTESEAGRPSKVVADKPKENPRNCGPQRTDSVLRGSIGTNERISFSQKFLRAMSKKTSSQGSRIPNIFRTESTDYGFRASSASETETLGSAGRQRKTSLRSPLPRLRSPQWHNERCFEDVPVVGHEWKGLYGGGSIKIVDTLEHVCTETGASFESEVFQDMLR